MSGECVDGAERIEVDGSTVNIGDAQIVVTGENGIPAQTDHVSTEDGYATFRVNGEKVTLRFLQPDTDWSDGGDA